MLEDDLDVPPSHPQGHGTHGAAVRLPVLKRKEKSVQSSRELLLYIWINRYSMCTPANINRMFKGFADETRLRILHLLTRGELCVCDLVETLKLPQSKVSRHLAYLRRAGLVQVRKQGLWKHYSLTKAQGKFHEGLLTCLKGCFDDVEVLSRDMATLRKRQKQKSC
jgi:ArsR family transcriptional regulator